MFGFKELTKEDRDRELETEYSKAEELTQELARRFKNIKKLNSENNTEVEGYKREAEKQKQKTLLLEKELLQVKGELERIRSEKTSLIDELEGIKQKLKSKIEFKDTGEPKREDFKLAKDEPNEEVEDDFDSELYEEAKKYDVTDWKNIIEIAKFANADFLTIKVFNEIVKERESKEISEERLKLAVSFLQEIKNKVDEYNALKKARESKTQGKTLQKYSVEEMRNLLIYCEEKEIISRISIGSIKFMIKVLEAGKNLNKFQVEELEKYMINARKNGYVASVDYLEKKDDLRDKAFEKISRETKEEKVELVAEDEIEGEEDDDDDIEFAKVKNIRNFQLEDWDKLVKFDEVYGIFTNIEKQVLNNIKIRIRNKISIGNSELSKGEQCLKKAMNNGYEVFFICGDEWERFLKISKNKNLLKPMELSVLESNLRLIRKYGVLSISQLKVLKDLYRSAKDAKFLKGKENNSKRFHPEEEESENNQQLLDEVLKFKFKDWNKMYMWAVSKKILSDDEIKTLRFIKSVSLMGVPAQSQIKDTIKIYEALKKFGYENEDKAKATPVMKPMNTLEEPFKVEVERDESEIEKKSDNRSPEAAIVRDYLDKLVEMNQEYLTFSQIAKAVNRDIFQVKSEMTDLGVEWHVGRGHSRKEIINKIKNQLKDEKLSNEKPKEEVFDKKSSISVDTNNNKITFESLLEKGLRTGTIKAIEIQRVDFDNELEVSDYYEALEELEDRGIRIEVL